MIEIVEHSNLLEVKSGIICHQVNCIGAMGAGIALQIKNKWPVVYKNYKADCDLFAENPRKLLGHVQDTLVSDGLVVANCFGQVYPGRRHGNMTHGNMTEYGAWNTILDKLSDLSNYFHLDLHMPYMIGCGLAGGNWNTMLKKIQSKFGHSDTKVFIHHL